MRGLVLLIAVTATTAVPGALVGNAGAAASRMPTLYKNCTNFNKKYPHGVGRVNAKDKTKSGEPVTTFKRSNKLYRTAMHYHSGLDRDKDGIACENG